MTAHRLETAFLNSAPAGASLEKNASSVAELPKTIKIDAKPRRKGGAIVYRHKPRRIAAGLLGPMHRLHACGHVPLGPVTLSRSESGAHWTGVSTCGSIWNCPNCAAKIAEGRKLEVEALLQAHRAAGGGCYMLTLTTPHGRGDDCQELRRYVADNWRKIQGNRPWLAAKSKFGILETIRALEVTHGANGWHPHLHILLLTATRLDVAEDMHAALFSQWADMVLATTGEVAEFAASDLRPAIGADYIAKWGAASETVKASAKSSRKGGRSPWQLLADYGRGDKQAGALYVEYTKAFFGARHLTYSKGCRERYGLRKAADQDLAEQGTEIQDELILQDPGRIGPIAVVSTKTWSEIVSWRLTGEVLAAVVAGGFQAAVDLLALYGLEFQAVPEEFHPRRPSPRQPAHLFHQARNRATNKRYFETMKAETNA